jgi:putative glutamine amidotransferase
VVAAEGNPVALHMPSSGHSWDEALSDVEGIVFLGHPKPTPRITANEQRLCLWCRDNNMPFLAVDRGLHVLNVACGGTLHDDLPRELPLALQHRHPPEPGVRHAIIVTNGTRLAQLYGEGEIVVNSEHTRAVNKVARGFRVSGRALDGVVEAIEAETDDWFAMGVQWHPASVTASGLDIQLFRGLVDAARENHALTPALQCAA